MIPWAPALVGYAIGSLPLGFALARRSRGIDLRRVGSGNVGATNAYRTSGLAVALAVMAADAAKGAAAVWLVPGDEDSVVAGVSAVVGQIYPVWLGFRGGKGVATAAGAFAVAAPWAVVAAAAAWAGVVMRTRVVSLGSMVAAVVLPLAAWSAGAPRAATWGAAGAAALVLVRHRGNARRLWLGTERAPGA